MANINPYRNFGGNCAEAFTFFKDTFGGEIADFCRFKDAPSEGQTAAEESEWVVHVSLLIGQGTVLMDRDRPPAMGEATIGNSFNIPIQTDSVDRFGVQWMVSQESG